MKQGGEGGGGGEEEKEEGMREKEVNGP